MSTDTQADHASLQQQVVLLKAESDSLARQLAQSFEELSVIRLMATHAALPETIGHPVELARRVLPELLPVVRAESLQLVYQDDQPPSEAGPESPSRRQVHTAGTPLLSDEQCLGLIDAHQEQARSKLLVVNHVDQRPDAPAGLNEFILAPLNSQGRRFGWLLACNKLDEDLDEGLEAKRDREPQRGDALPQRDGFTSVEGTLLSSAASIFGANLHNMQLFRQKERLFTEMVRALVNAVDARDPYTCGHSERVALYAQRLARQAGLPAAERERIYLSGLLHDVGKIAVPDQVLRKQGHLTDDEFHAIARHPEVGWGMLEELQALHQVLPGLLHHHENFDGSGYPDGLAGQEIPFDARVIAICDSYDAMTSDRPYRQGMPQEQAEGILRSGAGTQWDPQLVEQYLEAMPDILTIRQEYQRRPAPRRVRSR